MELSSINLKAGFDFFSRKGAKAQRFVAVCLSLVFKVAKKIANYNKKIDLWWSKTVILTEENLSNMKATEE